MSQSNHEPGGKKSLGRGVAKTIGWALVTSALIWWVVSAIRDNRPGGYEAVMLLIIGGVILLSEKESRK
jgi:hypothetical protein